MDCGPVHRADQLTISRPQCSGSYVTPTKAPVDESIQHPLIAALVGAVKEVVAHLGLVRNVAQGAHVAIALVVHCCGSDWVQ